MSDLTPAKVVGALALAAAGIAVWGVAVERNRFTLREVEVEALEPGASPIRVLHLSDLHIAPWQHRKMAWVRELANLKPDLIVNTGDNWGARNALEAVRATFAPFTGIPGVFVFGSNDYHGPHLKNPLAYFGGPSRAKTEPERLDSSALTRLFETELGWTNLNNSAAIVSVAGADVEFFGVDDPHHHLDDVDAMLDALDGVRAVSGSVVGRVGVTHAPYSRTLRVLTKNGADIMFAGHTHGGQVCVPGIGALVTNCDLPRENAKGLSDWISYGRAVPLHVSAGLGTSIYAPVRFACPPEATLLTLLARKN